MKRLISLIIALVLCLSLAVPAFAEKTDAANGEYTMSAENPGEQGRAEETEWIIRWADGLIQQRLWSITYGVWLTDWITVGYYDP